MNSHFVLFLSAHIKSLYYSNLHSALERTREMGKVNHYSSQSMVLCWRSRCPREGARRGFMCVRLATSLVPLKCITSAVQYGAVRRASLEDTIRWAPTLFIIISLHKSLSPALLERAWLNKRKAEFFILKTFLTVAHYISCIPPFVDK